MLADKKFAFPTKYWADVNKWPDTTVTAEAVGKAHSNLGRSFLDIGHVEDKEIEFK